MIEDSGRRGLRPLSDGFFSVPFPSRSAWKCSPQCTAHYDAEREIWFLILQFIGHQCLKSLQEINIWYEGNWTIWKFFWALSALDTHGNICHVTAITNCNGHLQSYMFIHKWTHTYIHTNTWTYMIHTHMHAHTHTCTCTHTYTTITNV